MPKESETTGLNDGRKWWLVGNATDVGISDKVVPANVQDSLPAPLVHCINPLYIRLVNCPAFISIKHYRESKTLYIWSLSSSLRVTYTSA